MKITHICLSGPVTDYWSYQDNLLTKYHKKLGYDVSIITSHYIWGDNGKKTIDSRKNYINENGIRVIRLKNQWGTTLDSKFKKYKGVYDALVNENPNVIFIHNLQIIDIHTITKFLKKQNEITVYVDNHADLSNSGRNWFSENILHKIIWKHQAKIIEPYATKFYGVLPARVDFLVDIYGLPKEKCELLVMGADDELVEKSSHPEVKKQIRNKYNIDKDEFLIVTGGKIDLAKAETLELMKAVHNSTDYKVKLLVFGFVVNELKKEFDSLCDGDKVQYVGWIKAEKSYDYFASADLVVFPGRHSVFWEQVVAQGIPMVCKYWEGTTHIDIGGNVKFITESNADEIYNVIKNFIEYKEKYTYMKVSAKSSDGKVFLYSSIAEKSIHH